MMFFSYFVHVLLLGAIGTSASALGSRAALKQKPKVLIDPNLYNTIVRYAGYCPTFPFPCQNSPPGTVIQSYAQNTSTDTQVTIYRSDVYKEIVVSFPGTNSLPDLLTDITFTAVPYMSGVPCPGCKAHTGFYKAWRSIQPSTERLLTAAIKQYPSYKVVVAGHSLGAAIASLAFAGLKAKNYKITEAYAYGQPRTGNAAYANFIDSLSGATDTTIGTFFRITHADDGVPQLPPRQWGFEHSRTELWAKNGKGGVPAANTTYRCFGHEPADCNDGAGGVGINEAHVFYPGLNVLGCLPSSN